LGVTSLEDLAEGIPDDAFTPKSGDDKATMAALKRRNKREREGQLRLQYHVTVIESAEDLARWRASEMAKITRDSEDDSIAIEAKAAAYESYLASEKVAKDKLKADLWTAAFFWLVAAGNADRLVAPTDGELQGINRGETPNPALVQGIQTLAEHYSFFHWPLEFPHVFENGGFDVILSNPPWERIKLEDDEWFASKSSFVSSARNKSERAKRINDLKESDPALAYEYLQARRTADVVGHFLRISSRFPMGSVGDINTSSVFTESSTNLTNDLGTVGIIVPTSIATEHTTRLLFQHFIEGNRIIPSRSPTSTFLPFDFAEFVNI
jgi:hypothetical protein